jgi:hypothetical protein
MECLGRVIWLNDFVEWFVGEGKGRGGLNVTGDGFLEMREEEEVEEAFGCFDETATIPTTCRLNRLAVYTIDSTQNRHRSWIVFGFVLSPR